MNREDLLLIILMKKLYITIIMQCLSNLYGSKLIMHLNNKHNKIACQSPTDDLCIIYIDSRNQIYSDRGSKVDKHLQFKHI